eukprot:gene1611-12736_t
MEEERYGSSETNSKIKKNGFWLKHLVLSIPLMTIILILSVCIAALGFAVYFLHSRPNNDGIPDKHDYTFANIGDWGSGSVEQLNIAEVLDAKEKHHNFDYIVSMGDNFYWNGVDNAIDPLFAQLYENIYENKYESLKEKTWLTCLGNHDWRKDPHAQIGYGNRYNSKWVMPDLFWKKELLLDGKHKVQMIFLDTTRFNNDHRRDYPNVAKESKQELVNWLKKVLEEGEGKYRWRFAYGHHIMYSGGDYGDFGHKNMTDIEDLFVKHKIDGYFCGHQHILQHLVVPYNNNHEIDYIITGSGGQSWSNLIREEHRFNKFGTGRQEGFVIHKLSTYQSSMEFIGKNGQTLYSAVRNKE